MGDMIDDYMTVKQAMEYLKISRQTLLKLRTRDLPYVKIGKKVLFRKSDIDAFMERHLVAPKKGGRRAGR